MKCSVNFPPVSKIISSFSPSGEPCQPNEFTGSSHSQREVLFSLEGTFRYMINDTVYLIEPGTAVLIPPRINHACGYRKSDNDLIHLWVFIQENGMYGIVVRVVDGVISTITSVKKPIIFSREMNQLLLHRWNQLEEYGKQDEESVKRFMKIPLELIMNEVDLQQSNLITGSGDHSVSYFLYSYIRNCSGRGCSLRKLSDLTGYSQSHISHLFLQKYGISIGTFIDKVRVEYAVAALNNHIKQKTIAEELGFSSPKAFWNWKQKFPELQKNNSRSR